MLSSTSVDSSEGASSLLTGAGLSSAGLRMNLKSISCCVTPNVVIVGRIGNDLILQGLQTDTSNE